MTILRHVYQSIKQTEGIESTYKYFKVPNAVEGDSGGLKHAIYANRKWTVVFVAKGQ